VFFIALDFFPEQKYHFSADKKLQYVIFGPASFFLQIMLKVSLFLYLYQK